jgi:hypothetical protein
MKSNLLNSNKEPKNYYDFSIHTKHKKDDYNYVWKDPKEKDEIIIRQNQTCEICSQFVSLSTNVLKCMYCNVVCHNICYEKYKRKDQNGNPLSEPKWICFYCQDSLQYDRNYYEQVNLTKNANSLFHESQIKISRNWRRYHQRMKYLKIYSSIVKMQIRFQVNRRKKQFLFSVQNKLRAIKIRINSISNVLLHDREDTHPANHSANAPSKLKKRNFSLYFIVSVHDSSDGDGSSIQTWRLDSQIIPVEAFPNTVVDVLVEEKFVLGGVSGFQTVILTLFQKNIVNNGRDIFLGQAALDLNRSNLWKTGGKFQDQALEDYHLDVIDPVGLTPIKLDLHFFEQHFSPHVFEPLPSHPRFMEQQHIPAFLRKPFKRRVNGSISFELITTNTMNAECCHCYGSCIEEVIRELGKLPDTTGFFIPNKKLLTAGHTTKTLNRIRDQKDSATIVSNNGNQANSIFSSAPVGSSVTRQNIPMKKMWLAISDGKLYLFSHFGDPLKLMIDLQHFSVAFDFHYHEKGAKGHTNNLSQNNATLKNSSNVIYKLYRMGYPEFHFYPVNESDIFPVKCAFITSLRYSKGFAVSSINYSNVSISEENNDNADPNNYVPAASAIGEKFDVNYLLEDLLALEILRTKRNAMKEAVMMSTPVPLSAHSLASLNKPAAARKTGKDSRRGSGSCVGGYSSDSGRDSDQESILSGPMTRKTIQLAPLSTQKAGPANLGSKPGIASTKNAKLPSDKATTTGRRKSFEELIDLTNKSGVDVSRHTSRRFSLTNSKRGKLTDNEKDGSDSDDDAFYDDLKYSRDDGDIPTASTKSSASLMKNALRKSSFISKRKDSSSSISLPSTNASRHSSISLPAIPKPQDGLLKVDIDESVLEHLNERQKKLYFSIVNDLEKNKSKLTEDLKTKLIEQLTLDEMVVNEKYQKYGENFIQNVLGKLTENQILNHQYHQHHFNPDAKNHLQHPNHLDH